MDNSRFDFDKNNSVRIKNAGSSGTRPLNVRANAGSLWRIGNRRKVRRSTNSIVPRGRRVTTAVVDNKIVAVLRVTSTCGCGDGPRAIIYG